MYEWSADRISKYPFDAEDLDAHHQHTIKTEMFTPYTFVDENDLPTGHIAIRYPDPEDESSLRFGFVIIDPERRRKGLGGMMLAAACEYSKNILKSERATLAVFTRNEKALRYCGLRRNNRYRTDGGNEMVGRQVILTNRRSRQERYLSA